MGEIEEGAETEAEADESSPSDFSDLAADFDEATETVVENESKQPAVSKSKPDAKHKLECARVAARYPSNIHVSGHHIGVWKSSVNDHQPGKVMEVDFTNIYDTAYAPGMDVLLFLYSSQHPDTKKVRNELDKLAKGLIGSPNVIVAAKDIDEFKSWPDNGRLVDCKTEWWMNLQDQESEPVYFFPAESKRQYKGLHGRDSIILVEDADHHKNPNKGVETFLQYEKLLHEHGSAYQRTKASARYFGISMPGSSTTKHRKLEQPAVRKVIRPDTSSSSSDDEPYRPKVVTKPATQLQQEQEWTWCTVTAVVGLMVVAVLGTMLIRQRANAKAAHLLPLMHHGHSMSSGVLQP